MSTDTVTVNILSNEYQIACPADEREALMQAASNLDERMRDIRSAGTIIGLERIAILAALNLSHELLQEKDKVRDSNSDHQALQRRNEKVDKALESL